MNNQKPLRSTQDRKSQAGGYRTTLPAQMPQLDELFRLLANGQTPDFLQFMAAVSEMVAFHVDCDINDSQLTTGPLRMSQKKCRFCD